MFMRSVVRIFYLAVVMTDCLGSRGIDEVRASILAQVIRKDYLEELVEKAKLLESQFGSDYPHELSRALQEIAAKETRI